MILGIDPGKMTGFARFDTRVRDYGVHQYPVAEAADYCYRILQNVKDSESESLLIACERWNPRAGVRTYQPDALEMIGFLRHITRIYSYTGCVSFLEIAPGTSKKMFPNHRMRDRFILPPRAEHGWDAFRVALTALHMTHPEVLRQIEGRDTNGTSTAGNRVQL